MQKRILVINPNSSTAVTRGIDEALECLRFSGGPIIEVIDLPEGPLGIETQRDVESAVPLLLQRLKRRNDADGYVIACYSDPGVHALREVTVRPVLGIAEGAILTALTLGARFGTIAILRKVIPRHLRAVGGMGLNSRMAGERAVDLGVAELANRDHTLARMIDIGRALRDLDGADVIIMGCAGMAPYREPLEKALGLPVVEPTQATVAFMIGRLRLQWRNGLTEILPDKTGVISCA
jgi:Asp/Glu/hydantoin racemase